MMSLPVVHPGDRKLTGTRLRVLSLRRVSVFQDFDLASIYVSDAQYNRNIYFDTSPQAVR